MSREGLPSLENELRVALRGAHQRYESSHGPIPDSERQKTQVAMELSSFMMEYLVELGYVDMGIEYPDRMDSSHGYLVVKSEGEDVIADHTWKKYLPSEVDASKLPDSLIGTREEVSEQATSYGVPRALTTIWHRPSSPFRHLS